MAVGHCYYFMEDIFPQQPGGWRILKTPQFLRSIISLTIVSNSYIRCALQDIPLRYISYQSLFRPDCCVTLSLRTPTTSLPLKTGLAASSGARYARNVKYWQISSFYLALYLALLSASRSPNISKKYDSILRLVMSMQKEKRMKRIELLWTH